MIIELNICDVCENKNRVEEQPDHGIKMKIELIPDYDTYGVFGSGVNAAKRTFCSKECMLDFFQNNTTERGLLLEDDS